MIGKFFVRAQVCARLQSGPLGPYLDALVVSLQEQQYSTRSIQQHLRAADAFGRWLAQQGLPVAAVNEATLARYIAGLGRRHPPSRPQGCLPPAARGLGHLIEVLREQGVVADPIQTTPLTAVAQWLTEFEHHLKQVRGASASTCDHYLRYARQLLQSQFGSSLPEWTTLNAQALAEFVRKESARLTPGAAQVLTAALRTLLRFLVTRGVVAAGLEGAVPAIRQMNPKDLALQVEDYLGLRRALGFTMRAEAGLLRDFVRFVQTRDLAGAITAPVAIDWACSAASRGGASGPVRRLSIVRGFLAYLRASVPETELPPPQLLGQLRRPKPYIYSETEIANLLAAALRLGPAGSLRPHTYHGLIGLLASTGLRVGEAIRLTMADVQLDLDPPQLEVRETKFHKSRLVPLHPTTAEHLRQYTEQRTRLGYAGRTPAFFVSESKGPLSYKAVRRTFVKLARRVGIQMAAGGRGPGVHALRHAFAVRRLVLWYQEGIDVRARLPHLSVYLGHVRPETTYWYLIATPALLSAAAARFAAYAEPGGDL